MAKFVNVSKAVTESATGCGAILKLSVEALLQLTDELSVLEVTTDTSAVYDVKLQWNKWTSENSYIRIYNNSSGGFYILCYSDAVQLSILSSSSYVISTSNSRAVYSFSGDNWISFVLEFGNTNLGFTLCICTDYFTNINYFGVCSCNKIKSFQTTIDIANNGAVVTLLADRGAGAYTNLDSGICAKPLNLYKNDSSFSASAFIGGMENIYYIYSGSSSFASFSGIKKFWIDDIPFISVGQSLAVRLDPEEAAT